MSPHKSEENGANSRIHLLLSLLFSSLNQFVFLSVKHFLVILVWIRAQHNFSSKIDVGSFHETALHFEARLSGTNQSLSGKM